MNSKTIENLERIAKKYPKLGLKYTTHNMNKKNHDHVDFGFFDVAVGKTSGNLMSPLGFGNFGSVRLTPDFQEYVNELFEEACKLEKELYKSRPRHSTRLINDKDLSVPKRVFDILDSDEHRSMVFDPKNYDVLVLSRNHIISDNQIEELNKVFNSIIRSKKMVDVL